MTDHHAEPDRVYKRVNTRAMLEAEFAHVRGLKGAERQFSALCLSGGGIRSASYCLGVMQVLARRGLLRQFDYLSTVSGGGYIGGWLQQLIHEKNKLDPAPDAESRARRAEDELAKHAPMALRRLRDHTNFLAPQGGIASPDIWASVALYLRHLILNWMVLLPVFLLVALAPIFHRTGIWFFGQFDAVGLGTLLVATILLAQGICRVCMWLPSHCSAAMRGDERAQARQRLWIVAGALGWSMLVPVWLELMVFWRWSAWFEDGLAAGGIWLVVGSYIAALMAGFLMARLRAPRVETGADGQEEDHIARSLYRQNLLRWLWASLGSGLVLLILLLLLHRARPWLFAHDGVADVLTLGGPMALLLVLLSQSTFYLGIRKRALHADLDREWLARMNGLILSAGTGWLLFAAACLIVPKWTLPNFGNAAGTDAIVSMVVAIGTMASGFAASWIGKQVTTQVEALTGQSGKGGWSREWALKIMPFVFIVALIGIIGTLLQFGIGRTAGLWMPDPDPVLRECRKLLAPDPPCPPQIEFIWAIVMQLGFGIGLWIVIQFYSGLINVNRFSMHAVYRNRLTRAFLGTPRDHRNPDLFTGFDNDDNPRLKDLRGTNGEGQRLFPVVNMTLNITSGARGAWGERKGASFIATPLFCGAADLGDVLQESLEQPGAYVPTACFACKENASDRPYRGPHLGSMMTVSGAAASPNWGYHSSPAVAFLMTLFNVRLGAWAPNPARAKEEIGPDDDIQLAKPRNSLLALLGELTGTTRADSQAVYLSDGGHFENLGVYEMIRRRCKRILVIDAGQDGTCVYFDLGMMIRKAEIDFPVKITIDTDHVASRAAIEKAADKSRETTGVAWGTITYLDALSTEDRHGQIIYIKPTLLADASTAVMAYAAENLAFPHEDTTDQWFSESQFESYRSLGEHQGGVLLEKLGSQPAVGGSVASLFENVGARFAPPDTADRTG